MTPPEPMIAAFNQPVVALNDVRVCKSGNVLLDGISLRVLKGEFLGVLGPNGAGKTTLLNVIAGLESFEGKLTLFGKDETCKRSRNTRLRIGYIPQMFEIDPAFPILALEAAMLGVNGRLGFFRSPSRHHKEQALRIFELMRMSDLAKRPLGLLSGGERQKVSLARAILQRPEILLMDEPTANLDPAVQKEFLDLIDEIHEKEGLTVLFVTHDFNMIPSSMGRMVLMKRGTKAFDGSVEKALRPEMLTEVFDYPIETFDRGSRRFFFYA